MNKEDCFILTLFFASTWAFIVWLLICSGQTNEKVHALENEIRIIKQSPLVPLTEEEFEKTKEEVRKQRCK